LSSVGFQMLIRTFCLSLVLCFSAGCRTYNSQSDKALSYWKRGQTEKAALEYGELARKNRNGKDHVIFYLEHGAALRAADQLEGSQLAFDLAEREIDEYEGKAKISITKESGAAFSNQANLPYRGRAYDKIMLNTYKALNYWEMGEYDKARTEIFRAYQRQQDAVEENKRDIEKAQEEAKKSGEKEKIESARNDPHFRSQMQNLEARLASIESYGDYVNPFTVFVDGLFFHYRSELRTDLERSRKSFERMLAFAPKNPYLAEEIQLVDQKMMSTKEPAPMVYVIFETGSAPWRDQIRIDIPIIISKVSYLGAAFPVLEFNSNFYSKLKISANGRTYDTFEIASMDRVVGAAFKKELPVIITKTLVSTVIKATAAYAINEAADQSGAVVGLLSRVGTAVAQAVVNIADLRTWNTLPKEFQYCRLPAPENGALRVGSPDGLYNLDLSLESTGSHIVYVRSVNKNSPLIVNHFKL
jgi:uncharacterized protein